MDHIISKADEDSTGHTAIFFSPHPDDETLGCGGTIIKKKKAGANIKIIFMTDGRKSNAHLMSENEIKLIRAREAIEVGQTLGLTKNDINFLEYRDSELTESTKSAVEKVSKFLESQKPDEIFLPHHREPSMWAKDHVATYEIVMAALQKYKKETTIYEFPIWLYYRPGMDTLSINPLTNLKVFKQILISSFILWRDFNYYVYIKDVLELKREALNHYRSQMTQLIPDKNWYTLGNLSNGKFLNSFFHEYEVFYRYTINVQT